MSRYILDATFRIFLMRVCALFQGWTPTLALTRIQMAWRGMSCVRIVTDRLWKERGEDIGGMKACRKLKLGPCRESMTALARVCSKDLGKPGSPVKGWREDYRWVPCPVVAGLSIRSGPQDFTLPKQQTQPDPA